MSKCLLAITSVFCTLAAVTITAEEQQHEAKSRRFEFSYAGEIRDVPEGENVRVWIPIPTATDDQTVELIKADFPAEASKR